jgi:hypothetical protein
VGIDPHAINDRGLEVVEDPDDADHDLEVNPNIRVEGDADF